MKCSEAIKELKEDLVLISETGDQDLRDAISLAIACLEFRRSQTHFWASSNYLLLDGETREKSLAHVR